MRAPFHVSEIVITSPQRAIPLPETGIIAVVGPNNAGKTTALQGVLAGCGGAGGSKVVVGSVRTGPDDVSPEEGKRWLREHFPVRDEQIRWWLDRSTAFQTGVRWPLQGEATKLLSYFAPLADRLAVVRPQEAHDVAGGAVPASELGLLFEDPAKMASVQQAFCAAFPGRALYLSGGRFLRLHVSDGPAPSPQGPPHVQLKALGAHPTLWAQGSGTQSFAGSLVIATVNPHPVLLIDEPEASLAPPQARRLGRELARAARGRQVFVATHSSDFLRGVLDADADRLAVLRLTRTSDETHPRLLSQAEVADLWDSPLLRFTNTLDGLFHDKVVVTEDDVDSRFYSWVAQTDDVDVQYVATAGKQNLFKVVTPLRAAGVDVRVVADFDVLRDRDQLSTLVDALGGDWAGLEPAWSEAHSALRGAARKPHAIVRRELIDLLEATPPEQPTSRTMVNALLDQTKEFGHAKRVGRAALETESDSDKAALVQLDDLLGRLRAVGLHVVPTGSLESFLPRLASGRSKGLRWLLGVLDEYGEDPTHEDLASARSFMAQVLA